MEDDQTDQTKDQIDGPSWSELLPPALEKVYSFLNRRDQISMSLVCRNWHKEYSSPSLWRSITFRLPGLGDVTRMCPEIIFARRFGAWFHHVKIIFPYQPLIPRDSMTAVVRNLKLLELFLLTLTLKTQLLSISFEDLGPYLQFKDEIQAHVHQMIIYFMKSQRKLRSVKIGDPFKSAGEIIKVLFEKNSKTLRHLCIPPFVLEKCGGKSTDATVDDNLTFLAFMNLEVLEVKYTPEFEKMMWSFYKNRNKMDRRKRTGRLKEMRIFRCTCSTNDGIRPLLWSYFRKIFPGLKIDLQVECDSMNTFIVSEMPLRRLDFIHVLRPDHAEEFGTLLCRIKICNLNKSLEVLKITWYGSALNLAPDLIHFTNICPELKTLELLFEHPVEGLDTMFDSWLKNRPESLEVVKITVFTSTRKEGVIYTRLGDFYAPLLQPLKLTIL